MNALEIVFGIVLMLFAIAIIIVVLLQESRWTKVIAIGFFVLVIVTNILMYFVV